MIGLDTNVIVRHLVHDDENQAKQATECISGLTSDRPGFVSDVVLVETYWVLRHTYGLDRNRVIDVLGQFVSADNIAVSDATAVRKAFGMTEGGADVADALVMAAVWRAGCDDFVTFDHKAAKVFERLTS